MQASILIVDDERVFLRSAARALRLEGYADVTTEQDARLVEALLEGKDFDIALLDVNMPHVDGLALLRLIKERSPGTECIMLTAQKEIELVIQAFRLGAYDWQLKPLRPALLVRTIERALEHKRLLHALLLRSDHAKGRVLSHPEAFADMATQDPGLLRVLNEAELHAPSAIPVLITGETGVGKELLARGIHRASRRSSGPFVAVNMLAISSSLFESEFFGHVRGAFTGAQGSRPGYLGRARGGTLFLDEIGDLPMEIQGKLLRILQEDEYVPVGKSEPVRADVRIVAATNQDLEARVEEGAFRSDLLYRLRYACLHLPPLRERRSDIGLLAAHFVKDSARPNARISPEAQACLEAHDWPGNVRELQGTVGAAANLAVRGTIEPDLLRLPGPKRAPVGEAVSPQSAPDTVEVEPLAAVERRHILATLEAMGGNKTRTAQVLGIGLQTLHRRLARYRED